MKRICLVFIMAYSSFNLKAQDRWGVNATIASDGVMEVGKYIDFHESDSDLSDYSIRLYSLNNKLHLNGPLSLGGSLFTSSLINTNSLLIDNPNTVSEWNNLWQSGFYESLNKSSAPEPTGWFWGLNMGHSSNSASIRYNGQIAIKNDYNFPTMYFRSTSQTGEGNWAKVITDYGNQTINGNLAIGKTEANTYSKLVIKGPSLPVGSDSKRDISFEFLSAGKAQIRSYRGSSWDTNIQFLTSSYSNTGGEPIARMLINGDGNVGIGTDLSSNPNNYKLAVNGTIGAKEIKVETNETAWPDYVFSTDYILRPLNEVEKFIKENKHLPEIPNAEEVKEGFALGEMNVKLLQKIEELTLYIIEQNKRIEKLESIIEKME